jgi:tetratricopeptide (TPR) repeat protein
MAVLVAGALGSPLSALATTQLAAQPADSMTLLKKAYAQLVSGNIDEAINILCLLIKNDRNNVSARRYLCYALLQRGDARQALEQLDALAQLNKGIAFDVCMRAQALQSLGELDKATGGFRAAMGMDPKSDYIRGKLIDSLQMSGKYQEASAVCAKGYYANTDKKVKDHYLQSFNSIQQARAYLRERGGIEVTTTTSVAQTTASTETLYGTTPNSFPSTGH